MQRSCSGTAPVEPSNVKVEAVNESGPGRFTADIRTGGDETTGEISANLEEDHLLPTPISAMNPHDYHDDHHEEMSELLGESPDADPDEGNDVAAYQPPAETNQRISTSTGTAVAEVAASATVSNTSTEVEITAGSVKVN
jgi:hypothetical protein